jgi:hypothetical protein
VEHQRRVGRVGEQPQAVRHRQLAVQGGRSHVEVPLGEVARQPLAVEAVRRRGPRVDLEAHVVVAHPVDRRDPAVAVEFVGTAQVEHGAQADRGKPAGVGVGEPEQPVGAVQPAGAHRAAVGGRVAAQVTEVEDGREREGAVDRHGPDGIRPAPVPAT